MGQLTLAEIRTAVISHVGERTDVGNASFQSTLDQWINQSVAQLALPSVFQHASMQKDTRADPIILTADVDEYTLPTDLFAIEFVVNESKGDRLEPSQVRNLVERRTDGTSSGKRLGNSLRYGRRGRILYLNAAPDDNIQNDELRVFYWAIPLQLTADTQKLEFENYWDYPVIHSATMYGWIHLNNLDKANFFREMVDRNVQAAAAAQEFETLDTGWRNEHQQNQRYSPTAGRRRA